MKDNYSKRRFYLNKREKNNSYNNDTNKEKKDYINIKTSFGNNSNEKEKKIRANTGILQNEYEKQKNIKNFILYSNESKLNNKKEETKKNINYFNLSHPSKVLFSPNNYVNKTKKNNYNDLQSKQEYNIPTHNKYNKSFEIIKGRTKRNFEESNNKNINNNDKIYNNNKDNMNKNMNDNITNYKIKNNSDKEKEKKNNINKEKNNRSNFFFFYNFRNKKKEIIKIQSIWRGYYSRKIKNLYIKKQMYLFDFIRKLKNIIKIIIKELYIDFVKLLNNYVYKKYINSKSFQINLTDKYNKRYYIHNNITSFKNNKEESSQKKERNEMNNNIQINNQINKKYYNRFKKKEKEKEDIEDDIFNNPIKIIYVPKKIYNNNRYYYLKRITKIKKIKLEEFVKFIHKKFICLYFKVLKDKYELNSKFYKAKILFYMIDSILKNYKKEYLRIYREKILEKKVNEQIMRKKTLNLLKEEEDNKIKKIRNRIIIKDNKIIKKATNKLKKNLERNIKVKFKENIINDIIIENIDESENEEENQNIYLKYKRKNKKNYFILLKKIVNKKIEKNLLILKKYFKKWKNFVNDNNISKKKIRNMYSPDMEIRGNRNKKRHIKIKYNNRALTSKTSLSSIKSDGRSNSSSNFYIKKMRIRSVVINTNNYSIINYKTENNDLRNIKLSNIITKIDDKNIINNCFKYWKKNKRIRRNLNKN